MENYIFLNKQFEFGEYIMVKPTYLHISTYSTVALFEGS